MIRDLLLLLTICIIGLSFFYDKSVKELLDNPPEEVLDLFAGDTTDNITANINKSVEVLEANTDDIVESVETSRMEQMANDTSEEVVEMVEDTKSRIEQATE